MGRIEVVLFQCPQCEIYVDSINITDIDNTVLGITNLSLSSCDSLVRVCIEVDIQEVDPLLLVIFSSPASFTTAQAYIAEVTFYNSLSTSSVCPLTEEIVTTEITANTDQTTDEETTDEETTDEETTDEETTDEETTDEETTDEETTNGSAMTSEAFIILTSITATLATVFNYE